MITSFFYRQFPHVLEESFKKRGLSQPENTVALCVQGDKKYRELLHSLQHLQEEKNKLDQDLGLYIRNKTETPQGEALKETLQNKKNQLTLLTKEVKDQEEALKKIIEVLPNVVLDAVPFGLSEESNRELYKWHPKNKTLEEREKPFQSFEFTGGDIVDSQGYFTPFGEQPGCSQGDIPVHESWQKDHVALGGLSMDFSQSRVVSGSRFVYLRGPLARLERALGQFLLDVHTKYFDYEEFHIPILVQPQAMYGAGQLPKFAQDLFETTNGYYLIPTGEVPLVTWFMDKTLTAKDLPMKMTTLSPCFRSEAGSAGRDTTGMLRHHQFYKVELVVSCWGYEATYWHEHMVYQSECLLRALDLPYRRVLLCSGDMGQHSIKTYDLEVWMPSQQCYREIASCSQCGDYQSHRMNARIKRNTPYEPNERTFIPKDSVFEAMEKSGALNMFPHTLNASGLPTGRLLMAILENHQDPEGYIHIPKILQPYIHCEKIHCNSI